MISYNLQLHYTKQLRLVPYYLQLHYTILFRHYYNMVFDEIKFIIVSHNYFFIIIIWSLTKNDKYYLLFIGYHNFYQNFPHSDGCDGGWKMKFSSRFSIGIYMYAGPMCVSPSLLVQPQTLQ